jgi:uncharacterized membrane protein
MTSRRNLSPSWIALVALFIALVTVFTIAVRVPVPATQGYVNLSDVAIVFISLAFGPWAGMIAGGVGAALADIFGGYAQFAPLSLLAHGLEGLVIGLIAARSRSVPRMLLAWLAGSACMVGVYLVGEALFLTSWPNALVEAPLNAFQALVGGIAGIPLVIAVRQAYPPIDQVGQARTWHE